MGFRGKRDWIWVSCEVVVASVTENFLMLLYGKNQQTTSHYISGSSPSPPSIHTQPSPSRTSQALAAVNYSIDRRDASPHARMQRIHIYLYTCANVDYTHSQNIIRSPSALSTHAQYYSVAPARVA